MAHIRPNLGLGDVERHPPRSLFLRIFDGLVSWFRKRVQIHHLEGAIAEPGPPKEPKIMDQYPKIESIVSIGSIILAILEVQVGPTVDINPKVDSNSRGGLEPEILYGDGPPRVEARKLEHDSPPIPNQRKEDNHDKLILHPCSKLSKHSPDTSIHIYICMYSVYVLLSPHSSAVLFLGSNTTLRIGNCPYLAAIDYYDTDSTTSPFFISFPHFWNTDFGQLPCREGTAQSNHTSADRQKAENKQVHASQNPQVFPLQ